MSSFANKINKVEWTHNVIAPISTNCSGVTDVQVLNKTEVATKMQTDNALQNQVATLKQKESENTFDTGSVDSEDSFWSVDVKPTKKFTFNNNNLTDKWSVVSADSNDEFIQHPKNSSTSCGEKVLDENRRRNSNYVEKKSTEIPVEGIHGTQSTYRDIEHSGGSWKTVGEMTTTEEDGNENNVEDCISKSESESNGNTSGSFSDCLVPKKEDDNNTCTIEMENDLTSSYDAVESPPMGASDLVKRYYNMMYYFGICSYRVSEETKPESKMSTILATLQKVLFWSFALLSKFETISQIKFDYLNIMSDQSYTAYVAFAYSIACILAKIYALYIFAFKKHKTEEMLQRMKNYETSCVRQPENNTANDGTKYKKWMKLPIVLAVLTLVLAALKAVIKTNPDNITDFILGGSHELSEDTFIWTSNVTDSASEYLVKEYGTSLTAKTVTMGCIAFIRDLLNYLQMGMLFDLVILVGFVMYCYVMPFVKEVKATTENDLRENPIEWNHLQRRREFIWKKYRMLRTIFVAVNEIFDPLFKLLHVRNLMTYAFFMASIIFGTNPWTAFAIYIVNLIKAEIGYVTAGIIAEQNDAIREWIQNWGLFTGKIAINGEELDAGILLTELEKQPVGLGKGQFLIHQTFHFKFVGLVWSIFFSMADEEAKN